MLNADARAMLRRRAPALWVQLAFPGARLFALLGLARRASRRGRCRATKVAAAATEHVDVREDEAAASRRAAGGECRRRRALRRAARAGACAAAGAWLPSSTRRACCRERG